MEILGIDVGGTGIKAALVDTDKGLLTSEKKRLDTPRPAKPKAVTKVINQLLKEFDYEGPVGCGFPTVIKNGVCGTWGNLDPKWLGVNPAQSFAKKTGRDFVVINDADAAAMAEMEFGRGKGLKGLVVIITIGTGLGSGMFYNGKLIPNIELGRMLYKKGKYIEQFASEKARKDENLDWDQWGERFNYFLEYVVRIVSPDMIILGGGASKYFDLFSEHITIDVPVQAALTFNNAGIIGAALAARK